MHRFERELGVDSGDGEMGIGMNQFERDSTKRDDEISLVDLATIFVRRRGVFFTVFVSIITLALMYAFFIMGGAKEYSSLIQLGEQYQQDSREPLVLPATIIATIENRWYPELRDTLIETEDLAASFRVKVTNPSNTLLIKLTSQAAPGLSDQVGRVHQPLVDLVIEQQTRELERESQALEKRLKSVDNYLDNLSAAEAAGEAAAQAVRTKLDLEARLNNLKPAEVLVVSRESHEDKGTSKLLIIVLAGFLATMAGVVAAFFAEFVGRVRQALAESKTS